MKETLIHLAILIVDPVWRVIDARWQLHPLSLDLVGKCVGSPLTVHLADEVIGCRHVSCIAKTGYNAVQWAKMAFD